MGCFKYKYGCNYFGTLTAFLQILDQIKGPMANISGLIPKFYSMTASAERLMELENLPDEKELNQLENISSVPAVLLYHGAVSWFYRADEHRLDNEKSCNFPIYDQNDNGC